MCYKYCDQDGKIKNTSKKDKYNINIHPRIIYFFSYFTIYSPYIGKKFSILLLGYGVEVILPLD